MTPKERVLSVFYKKKPGRLPWTAYGLLLPRGQKERKVRNVGCGLVMWAPTYQRDRRKVKIEQGDMWDKDKRSRIIQRTYNTPLGSVSEKAELRLGLSPNQTEWKREYMLKSASDYPIVRFIIENTSYYEDYDSFLEIQNDLGEDGVAITLIERSPIAVMVVDLMGIERFSIDLYENSHQVIELAELIRQKHSQVWQIVANSPAQFVTVGDNVTGDVVAPRLFEQYNMPFYNKLAELLHEKGKFLGVHMDGRLDSLKHLIARTEIDYIDSFTLPEGGGTLSLEEAKNLWHDKVIWANFPVSLSCESEQVIKEFMISLLKKVTAEDRFILEISEDLSPNLWQKSATIIAETIEEYGIY